MEIQCFFMEPTWFTRRYLRRYQGYREGKETDKCPCLATFHDKWIQLDEVAESDVLKAENSSDWVRNNRTNYKGWPEKCDCGYVFQPDDEWQVFHDRIYVRKDTGERIGMHDFPVGAMYFAPWLAGIHSGEIHKAERGDGPHLLLKTPGGYWDIDSPASNGKDGWRRTGEPPNVTAHPSIGMGVGMKDYHGWLRDGKLVPA